MSRDLTRRRHGRHRSFDRVRQPAGDSLAFIEAETVRLDPSEGQPGVHDAMHLVQGEGSFSTFEQVQAAADPSDIGLTPSFSPQTTSIEFNGIDEELGNATFQMFGIGNTWSLMVWMRRRGDAVGLNNTMSIFLALDSIGNDLIHLSSRGGTVNDPMRMIIKESAGVPIKDFQFDLPLFPFDSWRQVIFIWNGTTLTAHDNGALVAPTSTLINDAGTMADSNRQLIIGNNPSAGAQPYSGFIHSIALWDVDVTSAVAEFYNAGVASAVNLSAASFAANLQHWWRLGQDSADIGKDSGIGSPLIDVLVNAINIDASDISGTSPP